MAGMSEDDYQPSDLVWAKMRGYPQWPARIVPKPRNNQPPSASHYFVFFYGSHDVAWMSSKDLLPFEKYRVKFRRNSQRQRPGLNEAIWEAEEDPELMLSEARPILQELERVGKKGRRGRPSNSSKIKEAVNKRIKSEVVSDCEIKDEQQKVALDKSQKEEQVPEQHRERRRSARLQTPSDVIPKSRAKRKKPASPVPDHSLSPSLSVTKKRKEDLTEKENKPTSLSLSEPAPTHSYSTRTRSHNNGSIVQQLTSNYSARREISSESTYQEIHSEELKVVEEREQGEEPKSDEVQSKELIRRDVTRKESSEMNDKMEIRVVKKTRAKRKRRAGRMQEGDKVISSSDIIAGEEPSSQTDLSTENEDKPLTITIPVIESLDNGFLVKSQSENEQTRPTTTSNTTIEHKLTMHLKKLDNQPDVNDQPAQAVDNDLPTFIEDSTTDQTNSGEIDVTHQTSSGEDNVADQTSFESESNQVIAVSYDLAKVNMTYQTDSDEKTKVANEFSSEQGSGDDSKEGAIPSLSNQICVNESTSDTTGYIEGSTSETNEPVPSCQELVLITEESIVERDDTLQILNDVHDETKLPSATADGLQTVPMKDLPIVAFNDEFPADIAMEIENTPNNSKVLRATSPLVITTDCLKQIFVTENIHAFTSSESPIDTMETVPVLIINNEAEVKIPDIITDSSREMEEDPVVISNYPTLEIKLPDSKANKSMEMATENVSVVTSSDETSSSETSDSITDKSMEMTTENVPVITPSDETISSETSDSITDKSMEVAIESLPVITPFDETLFSETSDSTTDKSMEVAIENLPVIIPSDETSDSITNKKMEVATENVPVIIPFDETSDSITNKKMEVATENVPVITLSDETLTTETSDSLTNNFINVAIKPSEQPPVISEPSTSDISTVNTTTTKANSKEDGKPKKRGPPVIERAKVKPITEPPAPPRPPEKKKHPQAPRQVPIIPSMSMIEALKAYNYNLKASLVVDLANTQRALKHLRDLLDLQFTTSDIEEVKDLVYTLRKVRRFKGLARVRNRADEVYTKIKLLYMDEETKPKPKKGKKDGETAKRRPSSVVDQINRAAEKSKAVNGASEKTDIPDSLPEESNPPCASSSEKKSTESVDQDVEDAQEKESGRRRSRRTALRGRVNYSELCNEHLSEEEQTVPQL